jgi:hypothetical protein
VLRAFASTNGDYTRTATIVGMTAADVRAEIASLLNGTANDGQSAGAMNGAQHAPKAFESPAPGGKSVKAPVKAVASPAKVKPKKR